MEGNFTLPRVCASEAAYVTNETSGKCAALQPIRQHCSFPDLGVLNDPSLYGPATTYLCGSLEDECEVVDDLPGGAGLLDTDFVLYVTAKVCSPLCKMFPPLVLLGLPPLPSP